MRAVVETVIGNVKTWEVAKYTFRGYPEKQSMALLVIYQLTAKKLVDNPLR